MQARLDGLFRSGRIAALAALALGTAVAGCSTDRIFGGSSATPAASPASASSASAPASSSTAATSTTPSTETRVDAGYSLFFGGAQTRQVPTSGGPNPVDCPGVDIRTGAGTLTIPPDGEAMSLRYQVSISEMARSCRIVGSNLVMKVGVQGRIILGPAGGPGKLDIPMRFAVVHEGTEPKTVTTKFYKAPTTIPEGQTNITFTQIDDSIAFPLPSPSDLDAYVVYVGFDPAGAQPTVKKPAAKPAPRRRG
jgi:hypothetical protein